MENFTKCEYCKAVAIGEKRLGDEWVDTCSEHFNGVGQFKRLFK